MVKVIKNAITIGMQLYSVNYYKKNQIIRNNLYVRYNEIFDNPIT